MEEIYKEGTKYSMAGLLAHGLFCPFEGLLSIAVKTGLISAASLGPLYAAHAYVVDGLSSALYPTMIENAEQAHNIAHSAIDYTGLGLAVGIPLIMIGKNYYKNKRSYDH